MRLMVVLFVGKVQKSNEKMNNILFIFHKLKWRLPASFCGIKNFAQIFIDSPTFVPYKKLIHTCGCRRKITFHYIVTCAACNYHLRESLSSEYFSLFSSYALFHWHQPSNWFHTARRIIIDFSRINVIFKLFGHDTVPK